jgi:hypothetical protein
MLPTQKVQQCGKKSRERAERSRRRRYSTPAHRHVTRGFCFRFLGSRESPGPARTSTRGTHAGPPRRRGRAGPPAAAGPPRTASRGRAASPATRRLRRSRGSGSSTRSAASCRFGRAHRHQPSPIPSCAAKPSAPLSSRELRMPAFGY